MKSEIEELAKDCHMLRAFMISELPKGWIREVDQDYNIVYYDRTNNETSSVHPLSLEFRKKFHKYYARLEMTRKQSQSINDAKNVVVDVRSKRYLQKLHFFKIVVFQVN